MPPVARLLGLFCLFVLGTVQARADEASFYAGRTVTVLIGYSAGGGYDTYGRLVAEYLGRHIPGNPTVIPQNMPGAGSYRAANYLYQAAPKDGTVIGIFGRGAATAPLLGENAAQYDAAKFGWLGSLSTDVSVCVTWFKSPVKNWDDAHKTAFTVAGEGAGSDPDSFGLALSRVFGLKDRVITGYPGGNEMSLAMERGEVDGRCGWSWSSIKGTKSEWLKDRKLNVLVQLSLKKAPDLDAPLIMDLATSERQKEILTVIFARQEFAWPFTAPPGLPPERLETLRRAFDDMMADKAFVAAAAKYALDIDPVRGADIQKLVDKLYSTPKDVIAEARSAVGVTGK